MTTAPIRIDERAEAKALSGHTAWPTLALAAGLATFHASVIAAALTGALPLWAAILPLGLSAYAHYTLVHEAIHGNVVAKRHPSAPRAHDALGWYGSLVLAMTWPLLRRTHQRHHAHVNGPDDPDLFVHGPLARVLFVSAAKTAALMFPIILLKPLIGPDEPLARYLHADRWMTRGERWRHFGAQAAVSALVWAAILTGHAWPALALYVLPAAIGRTFLGIAFQWWPHVPFTARGRYDAARNGLPGWHVPMLYQNYHLMHHLWPSVPWYRYARLHARLRPVLDERGAA